MNERDKASITHRRVLRIAVPIVLANVTVPLLGAVDTAVVGQLGEAAPIGAVGIGAIIVTTIYGLFAFLRMGTSGLTSQARGRRDEDEVSALLIRSVAFAFCVGLFLVLVQTPLFRAAMLIAPASAEVEALASSYVSIRIFSAPAAIAIYGITGWLIAGENTRAVLILQLLMNGLNIGLDLLFVLVLDMGVPGVAWATLLSELFALILGLWLCRNAFMGGRWRNRGSIFDRRRIRQMLSVNSDIMVRSLLLQATLVSFLFLASDFGDVTLAANQILLQFMFVAAFALDGFAFAAEALVGMAFGAGGVETLRRASIISSIWGMAAAVVISLAFALSGSLIIDLMTTSELVREEARGYLHWAALMPLIGGPSWMLDGIFVGATRTRDMRNGMLVSTMLYCACLFLLLPWLANHGLWLAMLLMFLTRGATLLARYPALERSVAVNEPPSD
ncbi:MAG: MATE family efflux transporter [Rhodobacteraceae bacterium]|nr:MATE family efflux transporter [Paracoccaceae bacterium]